MRILALDPGRTTGYAISDCAFIAYDQQAFSHAQLDSFLSDFDPGWIICESFKFRQGKQREGIDLYALEMIGIVNLYVEKYLMPARLVFQDPSIQGRNAYFSDDKLKEMNLYQKEFKHGRSAIKHLLYWRQFGAGAQFGEIRDELVTSVWMLHQRR